ncbi:MAG: hypothetical protein ABSB59_44660 [Streptosporangiaceae bacterium]
MRGLIRRALVAASAAVALLVPAATASASASGTVVLSWAPTTSAGTYNYGTLHAGQTVSKAFSLTNSGSTGTSALKITLSSSSAFIKTADTCTGTSLGPKKTCSVTITYAPATSGQNDTATLTGTSNKPAATASLTLRGASAPKSSPAIATTPSPGGPVGSTVRDTARLSGGSSPTGTIEFKLYGPSAPASCSGTAVFDKTVRVAGNGNYSSPSFTPTKAGTYWWTASYGGDPGNTPAASGCGGEQVIISGPKSSPAITTTPSPGGPVGTTVQDTAALSGGSSPTGMITFNLYGPSAAASCSGTPVDTETAAVTGNGDYTTPAGATPSQAGTYWWTASYGGDAGNTPAASGCGAEQVIISPLAVTAITTTPSPGGPSRRPRARAARSAAPRCQTRPACPVARRRPG